MAMEAQMKTLELPSSDVYTQSVRNNISFIATNERLDVEQDGDVEQDDDVEQDGDGKNLGKMLAKIQIAAAFTLVKSTVQKALGLLEQVLQWMGESFMQESFSSFISSREDVGQEAFSINEDTERKVTRWISLDQWQQGNPADDVEDVFYASFWHTFTGVHAASREEIRTRMCQSFADGRIQKKILDQFGVLSLCFSFEQIDRRLGHVCQPLGQPLGNHCIRNARWTAVAVMTVRWAREIDFVFSGTRVSELFSV